MSSTNVHEEAALIAAAELCYRTSSRSRRSRSRLGVSRSTVSRMLHSPVTRASSTSSNLWGALGRLRTCRIRSGRSSVSRAWSVVPASARSGLHVIVAPALDELVLLELAPGDALAVSWGSTVAAIAQSRQLPPLPEIHVIPAIAAFDEPDGRFRTTVIARRIAELSGADLHFLHGGRCPRRGSAERCWRTRM